MISRSELPGGAIEQQAVSQHVRGQAIEGGQQLDAFGTSMISTAGPPSASAASAWAPFRHLTFAVLWTATVVANIGTWMYNAASGWLMTSLNPDPLAVSLVQAATTLPMFMFACLMFAVPAGALADIFDKRRFLIVLEIAATVISAIYATLVVLDLATPGNLLLFSFLIGAAGALTAPPWQSVVPQLVPKEDLAAAVAANSVGINVSRAVGPALGGLAIGSLGIAAPAFRGSLFCRPSTSPHRSLCPIGCAGAVSQFSSRSFSAR